MQVALLAADQFPRKLAFVELPGSGRHGTMEWTGERPMGGERVWTQGPVGPRGLGDFSPQPTIEVLTRLGVGKSAPTQFHRVNK
jgi:hypothetical protein